MTFITLREALNRYAYEALEPDQLYIFGCETEHYAFNLAIKMTASGESYRFVLLPPPEVFEDQHIIFTGFVNATDIDLSTTHEGRM